MNLLKFLRTYKNPLNNTAVLDTVRGAKRKGEKKQEGVLTEHILNVFKNAEDVAILPDKYYPPWIKDLAKQPMWLEEFCGNAYAGVTLPNTSDQFTMMKKLRRSQKFKLPNRLKHANALFEKKWEQIPEGDENQLDVEWGALPQVMEDFAKEDIKKMEAMEGGGGGSSFSGGADKKTE